MITKDEINNLDIGIYRFYWNTGGDSVVAVGIDRDGNQWLSPLNWVSPSDINYINDGDVTNYVMLLDSKGK